MDPKPRRPLQPLLQFGAIANTGGSVWEATVWRESRASRVTYCQLEGAIARKVARTTHVKNTLAPVRSPVAASVARSSPETTSDHPHWCNDPPRQTTHDLRLGR